MSFFGSLVKVAGDVIKSPVTKAAAGGLAIVFPPVGVPAVAAVATANAALAYAEPAARAVAGAADKAAAAKRGAAKATIRAQTAAAIKRGVPRAKANAAALAKARLVARTTPAPRSSGGNVAQHRAQLAAQLRRTQQLAAQGDVGAKRALSTFKLVSAARKGDPKAKQAVALIAHRWEVGQRVRNKYQLTAHGRIRPRSV